MRVKALRSRVKEALEAESPDKNYVYLPPNYRFFGLTQDQCDYYLARAFLLRHATDEAYFTLGIGSAPEMPLWYAFAGRIKQA